MDRATEAPLSGVRDVWAERALAGLGGSSFRRYTSVTPLRPSLKCHSSTENLFV